MSNSTVTVEAETVSLHDLLPTLSQIFLTIKLGWLAGTFNIIKPPEARGLNIFVGKYSLPSLVFISLATFDFTTVNLAFLLGVFASKLVIFVFTILSQILICRDASKGAMWAMFCTQTNDFAMGLPLLEAVLGQSHIYVSYLYLVAPISLLILNPIGFIILEANRVSEEKVRVCNSVVKVVKGLLMNPILVMTMLGVFTNLIFSGQPPRTLELLLTKLGAAFSAVAPFTLGLGMVGKFKHLRGGNLSILLIMMIIKCFLAPLTTHTLVGKINSWLYGEQDSSLMNFSFLYGTFPPALGVMSYASQYQVSPELVSAGIVLCTAVSAPLMFLSAQILRILRSSLENSDLISSINSLNYTVGIGSIIGVGLTLNIFLLSRRFLLLPHCFTTAMLVESLLAPTAAVLLHSGLISADWQKLCHEFGVFSVQISSAVLAVSLVLILKKKKIGKVRQLFLVFSPAYISGLVILLASLRRICNEGFIVIGRSALDTDHDRNIAIVIVNSFSLVIIISSLTYIFRRRNDALLELEASSGEAEFEPPSKLCSGRAVYLEDGGVGGGGGGEGGGGDNGDYQFPQVFRHSLLLLLLVCSIIADLTLPVWQLAATEALQTNTGAYKVMLSLNVILTTGQGILIFSVFILDCHYIINPSITLARKVSKKVSVGSENFPVLSKIWAD